MSLEVNSYHKVTPQNAREISKSLQEYVILQGCSEFVHSIKSRTMQYPRQRDIFLTIHSIFLVCLRFQQYFLSSAHVVLSRTPGIPRQKHTSEHVFSRTDPSGRFCTSNLKTDFQSSGVATEGVL